MERFVIGLMAAVIFIMGCGEETTTTPAATDTEQETPQLIEGEFNAVITIVNDGMSAWLVTAIEGRNATASINSQNASISLTKGFRYKFINLGGPNHPLDFRDSAGGYLITQDTISGKYEEDVTVDYVFNYGEGSVSFTISDELAEELATYNCTIHVPMTGDLSLN